jgi:hypothetical protein
MEFEHTSMASNASATRAFTPTVIGQVKNVLAQRTSGSVAMKNNGRARRSEKLNKLHADVSAAASDNSRPVCVALDAKREVRWEHVGRRDIEPRAVGREIDNPPRHPFQRWEKNKRRCVSYSPDLIATFHAAKARWLAPPEGHLARPFHSRNEICFSHWLAQVPEKLNLTFLSIGSNRSERPKDCAAAAW